MSKTPYEIEAIIEQMGGKRIFAMAFTGSAYEVSPKPAITFRIAPGLVRSVPGRLTHVKVTLEPSDTYTVEFLRCGKFDVTAVKCGVYQDIYCDGLKSLVEEKTGLALSL